MAGPDGAIWVLQQPAVGLRRRPCDVHGTRSSTTGGAVRNKRTPVPNGSVRSRDVSITGTRRTLDDVDRPP